MNKPDTGIVVVYCTAPPDEAESIAKKLLEEKLIACGNLFPVRSIYKWEGAVCDEPEQLMIMKTQVNVVGDLVSMIQKIHPYDLPEVIVLPVTGGSVEYISWVLEETKKQGETGIHVPFPCEI